MSEITIQATFTNMTKDKSKEGMTFSVKGEDERKPEIPQMTREAVLLKIEGVDQEISAEFVESSKKPKETVLKFVVKGDRSKFNSHEFYKRAGSTVTLTIKESQMSIEDLNKEEKKGLEYQTNGSGVVSNVTDPNQQTIDDLEEGKKQAAASSEGDHREDDLELA